jgi:hypothetical protein
MRGIVLSIERASPHDACAPLQPAEGKTVLIEGGSCALSQKLAHAHDAGALAAIVTFADCVGDCYEAYLPDFPGCSGYETAGYTCVGDYCSASNPSGDPSFCAVRRDGCVDRSTGKCSTEGTAV